MKQRKSSKTNVVNFSTYLGMVIFFLVMTALSVAARARCQTARVPCQI